MLAALGKSLLSRRKKKKPQSGKDMSNKILNRSENVEEDKRPVIKPQNSLVPLSIKTTTIPTANLITTKEDSIKDKLLMIKDLLGLQLKLRVSSFSQRIKSMREERRKNREKELEENKQKKGKSPKFLNLLPKIGILDSLKNFLAFLAGGFLLNLLFKYLPEIQKLAKKLAPIAKGVMQFGKFMWEGVIGFIVKAYDGYDALRESIRNLGGDEAVEKFDKVATLLKKVINGAIILAALALAARPFMPRRGGRGGGGPCPPCNPCVCKIDPQRVPSLETQLSSVTQLQPDAATSPGFNWGRIFDPIRDILGALGKKKSEDVINPAIDPVLEGETAYATERLSDAVTASDSSLATVEKLLETPEEVEQVIPINPDTGVYYTPEDLKDKPLVYADVKAVREGLILANKVRQVSGAIIQGVAAWLMRELVNVPAYAQGGSVPPISSMKSTYDDLATNTSYSQGSYGMITNTTTIIQPVVQEV